MIGKHLGSGIDNYTLSVW